MTVEMEGGTLPVTLIFSLVVGVVLVAVLGGRSIREGRAVLIDFVAPRNSLGWLAVRWDCSGGQRLADSLAAGRCYELRFPETGAICVADAFPEGYRILGYRDSG